MWTKLNTISLSLYTRAQLLPESLYTRRQLAQEEGQTAVEYAMVIGLVSAVVVTTLIVFGPKLENVVNGITI